MHGDKHCSCRGIHTKPSATSLFTWIGNDSGAVEGVTEQCESESQGWANAQFVVAAHRLVPALLSRLEAAERERDEYRRALELIERHERIVAPTMPSATRLMAIHALALKETQDGKP